MRKKIRGKIASDPGLSEHLTSVEIKRLIDQLLDGNNSRKTTEEIFRYFRPGVTTSAQSVSNGLEPLVEPARSASNKVSVSPGTLLDNDGVRKELQKMGSGKPVTLCVHGFSGTSSNIAGVLQSELEKAGVEVTELGAFDSLPPRLFGSV